MHIIHNTVTGLLLFTGCAAVLASLKLKISKRAIYRSLGLSLLVCGVARLVPNLYLSWILDGVTIVFALSTIWFTVAQRRKTSD